MYKRDKNKAGGVSRRYDVSLATSSESIGRDGYSPDIEFYELEPAQVVEIISDSSDSKTFGKVRLRPLHSHSGTPQNSLPIAYPLEPNVKSYPLVGEYVICAWYGETCYYGERLNFANNVNNNLVRNRIKTDSKKSNPQSNYQEVSLGNPNVTSDDVDEQKPGKYFQKTTDIKSLIPLEGDIIYEGRFGNSIRFGGTVDDSVKLSGEFSNSWVRGESTGSPILIIRNGQSPNVDVTSFRGIVEHVNGDSSSIYLTHDQRIPLIKGSDNQDSYKGTFPSVLDGKQVIITSDRIILNARVGEIFLLSNKSIGLSTNGTMNIDASTSTTINSPRISFGIDASEPLAKGNELVSVLRDLIIAITKQTHPTPAGVSGPPINIDSYSSVLKRLENILSDVSYTR